jgi:hypothetical protein
MFVSLMVSLPRGSLLAISSRFDKNRPYPLGGGGHTKATTVCLASDGSGSPPAKQFDSLISTACLSRQAKQSRRPTRARISRAEERRGTFCGVVHGPHRCTFTKSDAWCLRREFVEHKYHHVLPNIGTNATPRPNGEICLHQFLPILAHIIPPHFLHTGRLHALSRN